MACHMEFAAPQKLHRILKNRKLHVSTICFNNMYNCQQTLHRPKKQNTTTRYQHGNFPFESSFVQWIATTFLQKNLSCMYSLCMDVYSASLMLSRSCALSWLFAKETGPSILAWTGARCNRTTSQTPLRFSPYLTVTMEMWWRLDL